MSLIQERNYDSVIDRFTQTGREHRESSAQTRKSLRALFNKKHTRINENQIQDRSLTNLGIFAGHRKFICLGKYCQHRSSMASSKLNKKQMKAKSLLVRCKQEHVKIKKSTEFLLLAM